jgi:hypothetical protein
MSEYPNDRHSRVNRLSPIYVRVDNIYSLSQVGSVVVQYYKFVLLFINFDTFLNKMIEIRGTTMKGEASAKISFFDWQIANRRRFMEPIIVN